MPSSYPIPSPHGYNSNYTFESKAKQLTQADFMLQLLNSLNIRGVGFNTHSTFFQELQNLGKPSYPPYDILGGEDGEYKINIALAGFKKSELAVELDDNILTVKSVGKDEQDANYFHKGIAARAFTLKFPLADYVRVEGAELEDGILTIELKREVPEELLPKAIKIK
jgi:molecular chaperone IbpA